MGKIPRDFIKLSARLSQEIGVPLDDILHAHVEKKRRIKEKITSQEDKYTILCVNRFEGEDFVYDNTIASAEEALRIARKLTEEARGQASDHSVATVFLAYDPNANYIGGDTWVGE